MKRKESGSRKKPEGKGRTSDKSPNKRERAVRKKAASDQATPHAGSQEEQARGSTDQPSSASPSEAAQQGTPALIAAASDNSTSATPGQPDDHTRESDTPPSPHVQPCADYSEVAAYEVGVRLQQAIILSKLVAEKGSVHLLLDLMDSLVRLQTAFEVAITELEPLKGDPDLGRALLEGAEPNPSTCTWRSW